jgi:hypothetical protein
MCDMPGCGAAGAYRAPKSRRTLRDWWWFCLEHVRAYNAGWDYYKGMTPAEIELQIRADTAWDRPTWPLGRLGRATPLDQAELRDPLGVLGHGRAAPRREDAPAEIREPLSALGLAWPVTLDAAHARWKDLVKQHHPDAHGGDRAAEDRLKDINRAWTALRRFLSPPAAAAG